MAMPRICVIGNSHLAAFKHGWEMVRHDFPSVEAVFFGAVTSQLVTLEVRDSVIAGPDEVQASFRTTSGGQDILRDEYDRYVVCGARFAANVAAAHYRSHFSRDLLFAAVKGCLANIAAMEVVSKIKQMGASKIAVVPAAMPVEGPPIDSFEHIEPDHAKLFASVFADVLRSIEDEHDIEIHQQSVETLANPLRTKAEYGRGAPRLRNVGGQPLRFRDEDPFHMNAEYGAVAWRDIFARWGKARAGHTAD